MEQELSQVRNLMEGLSSRGSELSETMQSMKPPVSDAPPARMRGLTIQQHSHFTALCVGLPGEPVPEETLTHPPS